MNIDKKALKGIVDEIEASRARQRGETEFQREVMKRAKAHQLDAKAIRIVLQRRAMGEQKRDEQDYYVHSYELALGGKKDALEALERGATVREAAKAGGISTGAAGKLRELVHESTSVDANPETGEITPNAPAERPDTDAASPSGPLGDESVPQAVTQGEEGAANESCGGVESRHARAEGETQLKGVRFSVASDPEQGAGVAPGPQDLSSLKAPDASGTVIVRAPEDDELAFPPFLKRQPQATA